MRSVVEQILGQAWSQFASQCLVILPNVIAGLLFLGVGAILTVLAGSVARLLLRRSAVERQANRLGLTSWLERAGLFSATACAVRLVQGLFAVVTAGLVLYALDAALASDLTRRFFLYVPHLAVGLVIFVAGLAAARLVERRVLIGAVNRGVRPARPLAALTRAGIVILASAISLDHIGIGGSIVPAVLLILTGGVTLAAALAVGLGSRDAVKGWIAEATEKPEQLATDEIEHW